MKILYVSDNRCRPNFGCRATSTALSQLVGEDHEIVGHISGAFTNWNPGNLVVNDKWSERKYKRLGNQKYWGYISQMYYMAHRFIDKKKFFLGHHDFISYDLEKSIENLIKCIPANDFLKEFDLRQYDFDAMVVNGEGSFIFATPAWRESMILMMLMYWALKMGKKVYFLNAMLSDDPNSEHNTRTIKLAKSIFKKCEVVQLREHYSELYYKKYFGYNNLVYKPDALFTWFDLINDNFSVSDGKYFIPFGRETDDSYHVYDYGRPYILLCGSSSSKKGRMEKKAIEVYSLLCSEIKKEFPDYNVYLIEPCDGDVFLEEVSKATNTPLIPMETNIIICGKILANAALFFTGRYHPAILGSLGGTPCVFMDSNSHKNVSLQEILGYPKPHEYSCVPNKEEIKRIIKEGKYLLEKGEVAREEIKKRSYELCNQAREIKGLIK